MTTKDLLENYNCNIFATLITNKSIGYTDGDILFVPSDEVLKFVSKKYNVSIKALVEMKTFIDIARNHFGSLRSKTFTAANGNKFSFDGKILDKKTGLDPKRIGNNIFIIKGLLATAGQRELLGQEVIEPNNLQSKLPLPKNRVNKEEPHDIVLNKLDNGILQKQLLNLNTAQEVMIFCKNTKIMKRCKNSDINKQLLNKFYPKLFYTNNPYAQFEAATEGKMTQYKFEIYENDEDENDQLIVNHVEEIFIGDIVNDDDYILTIQGNPIPSRTKAWLLIKYTKNDVSLDLFKTREDAMKFVPNKDYDLIDFTFP